MHAHVAMRETGYKDVRPAETGANPQVTVSAENQLYGNPHVAVGGPLYLMDFRARMRKVLYAAYIAGCAQIVLGAWGCGVFRNDPAVVATLWRDVRMCSDRRSGVVDSDALSSRSWLARVDGQWPRSAPRF